MTPTKTRYAVMGASLLVAVFMSFSALQAHEPNPVLEVEAEHVTTTPLPGDPDREIDIQLYTFPPGIGVPWHIHKDSIEIAHVLKGALVLEKSGKPSYEVAEGETNILSPNVVHRGWNPSKTEPTKLYVVRIKPKGEPLATIVSPPDEADGPPSASEYPDDE